MKSALTVLLLSSALALWGQVYSSGGPVVNNVGQPVAAQIAVCTTQPPLPNPPTTNPPNCSVYAATYTDATLGTPCTLSPSTLGPISGAGCTNPGKTDSRGNYTVFAFSNVYYLEFYGYGITTYIMPISTATTAGNFSSPPPIGNVTPNTGQFTVLNNVIDPLTYSGSDVGAKINAAISANSCSATNPCHVVLPPSPQLSFSTSIQLPSATTLECTQSSYVDNNTVANQTLNYTGSGVALEFIGSSSNVIGCDIKLGSSATKGIWIGHASNSTYSNHIFNSTVYGGGTSTILVHISGTSVEDAHFEHSRCSNFVGVCVQVDHANDVFLEHDTAYGTASNTTGLALVIDSNAGGIHITDFSAGNVGLHGLVVRHTLGGNYPANIFAKGFVSDLASSDGWLFDSSLGAANIVATFSDSWAAGSGGCGVNIAGGAMLTITGGSEIRVNQNSGVCMSTTGHTINISGNKILGNNQSNSTYSGIDISNHPGETVIVGNAISNYPEVGGHQVYAINAASDVEGLTFTGNVCDNNATGCQNLSSVTASKLQAVGNIDAASPPPALIGGAFTVNGLLTAVSNIQMTGVKQILGSSSNALNVTGGAGATSDFAVQKQDGSLNWLQVNEDGSILIVAPLKVNGVTVIDTSRNASFAKVTIGGTNTAPVMGAPVLGQGVCQYASGPPAVLGHCTSVVGAGGACTCAP